MTDTEATSPLKAARIRAGLSQAVMANKLDLTVATVSRIETGNRDTPFSNAERWYAECGYALIPTPLGTTEAAESAREAFANLPHEALYEFLGVMKAWPKMTEVDRRVVSALLSTYAREYATVLTPLPVQPMPPEKRRGRPPKVPPTQA